jgi:5-methylcytosine-specific restriction endonuclease McrA
MLKRHLFEAQGGLCCWCGEPMKIEGCFSDDPEYATIEHLVSRARGGPDHVDNVSVAHKKCNDHRENRGENSVSGGSKGEAR